MAHNDELVALLIRSLHTPDREEAKRLISLARKQIEKEKLNSAAVAKINSLLDLVEARVMSTQSLPYVTQMPINPLPPLGHLNPPPSSGSPIPRDVGSDDLARLLAANPDMRSSLFEIGQARLARDANQVDAIVEDKNGQSTREFDAEERNRTDSQDQFGVVITALKKLGLIAGRQEFIADNLALHDKYPDTDIDDLADLLIRQYTERSFLIGVIKHVAINQSIIGGQFMGLSTDAIGMFIVNANLLLRLANLYDLRLSGYEEEVMLLGAFSLAKVTLHIGVSPSSPANPLNSLASKLGGALRQRVGINGTSRVTSLLNKITSNKFLNPTATTAGPSGGSATPSTSSTAGAAGSLTAAAGTTSAATTPAATTKPGTSAAATSATPAGAPASNADSLKTRSKHKGLAAISTLATGAWSAAQTYAIGTYIKTMLIAAHRNERARYNESFRKFLMTPDGDSFFKLLILSINIGKANLSPINISDSTDQKIQYILNLARSSRICSPTDLKLFKSLGDQKSPGKIGEQQQEILEYACNSALSQGRFARLNSEFQTFNSIPQDALPDLRVANRQYRLRMGELLLQMQFLDGDRDWDDIKFFETIASKYLGLDNQSDRIYFKRLQAYIIDNGGMKLEESSPTGFTISVRLGKTNPYDMNIGYTTTNGPDLPGPPAIQAPGTTSPSQTTSQVGAGGSQQPIQSIQPSQSLSPSSQFMPPTQLAPPQQPTQTQILPPLQFR
jgi:hypothetical protein